MERGPGDPSPGGARSASQPKQGGKAPLILLSLLVTAPVAAQAPSGDWLPRGVAEIRALDKVYARSTVLPVRVGNAEKWGTLVIVVGACLVRPPDQAADATAFLTITDGQAATPIFRGWMFAATPALAMLEHPIYDIRVLACRP